MSSQSTSLSSDTSNPSSTSTPQPPSSPPSQGNLYLFTFLATLLVLLLISCSIVFRSFVLRRRYQRRLQEALASGGVLAPRTQGSHRKRFRTRPKFFDVWLNEGGDTWEDTMPVAACAIKPKRRPNATTESGSSQTQSTGIPQSQTARARLTSFTRGLFTINRSASSSRLNIADSEPSSPATPTIPSTPFDEKPDPLGTSTNLLQVSVLVAMPSPRRYSSAPSEEIPDVCFGVTRLPCKIPSAIGQGP